MKDHNLYPKHKIDFINHLEVDESIGKYFNSLDAKRLAEYNQQYDSTNHYDMVRDSGRKNWR